MFEKRGKQALHVDPHRRRVNRRNQLFIRIRNEIAQVDVFHLIPTRLHRIQFRRIGRKVFELEPIRMLLVEIRLRRVMSRKMIPEHQHLAAETMMKGRQIEHEILEPRRSFENRETKFQKMAEGSSRDETETRMVVSAGRFENDWRFTDRRPSSAAIRNEREAAFVPDCQRQTVVVRFFLIRGQTCSRQ